MSKRRDRIKSPSSLGMQAATPNSEEVTPTMPRYQTSGAPDPGHEALLRILVYKYRKRVESTSEVASRDPRLNVAPATVTAGAAGRLHARRGSN